MRRQGRVMSSRVAFDFGRCCRWLGNGGMKGRILRDDGLILMMGCRSRDCALIKIPADGRPDNLKFNPVPEIKIKKFSGWMIGAKVLDLLALVVPMPVYYYSERLPEKYVPIFM